MADIGIQQEEAAGGRMKELEERVEYLEGRERDLLMAAEIGRQLLEKNTELDMENSTLIEENKAMKAELNEQKERRKSVFGEREEAGERIQLLEEEVRRLQDERTQQQAQHKAQTQQMQMQQDRLEAEVQQMVAQEAALKEETEKLVKEQEVMKKERSVYEEMGDVEVLEHDLVKEMRKELEGKEEAALRKVAEIEKRMQSVMARVSELENEAEGLQDVAHEKEELAKAVNSLARANHVLQKEQKEYQLLLREEKSTSAALMRKLEEKRTASEVGGLSLVDEVGQLAEMLRKEEEESMAESLGEELEEKEEEKVAVPVQTRDIGVQCVYIPLELMQDEEEGEKEEEVPVEEEEEEEEKEEEAKDDGKEAEEEEEKEDVVSTRLLDAANCTIEQLREELAGMKERQRLAEEAAEAGRKDKRVLVATIKKLDADCKHTGDELLEARAEIRKWEKKKEVDTEREMAVLEKVLEIRERLSYVQRTINSAKMQSVLKGDELELITKALIESAVADSKKLLEEQGEAKLYGQSKEWVCQIYELTLHNAELFYRLKRSFVHLASIKEKYNRLVLIHNDLLQEREREKNKKWWHFGKKDQQAPSPAPSPSASPAASTAPRAAKSPRSPGTSAGKATSSTPKAEASDGSARKTS